MKNALAVDIKSLGKLDLVTVAGRDHGADMAATETRSSQIVLMCVSAPLIEGQV